MLNSLDLLIIIFAVLVLLVLTSVIMMFALKNHYAKMVFFYITVIITLYTVFVGYRMFWPMYIGQAILSSLAGLASIASVVLTFICKNNKKMF